MAGQTERVVAGTGGRVLKDKGRKAVEKKAATLKALEIRYIPVEQLSPNPWNPNRQSDHDFELLLRSMEEDGFTQPIVAVILTAEHVAQDPRFQKGGYQPGQAVIVDGEHRWRAARQLGFPEVPIVVTPMTIEQMRVSTLRHNRARGTEDIELAADVLKDLQALGALDHAMDSLMLDDVDVNKLLEDIPAPEALAADEYSQAWEVVPPTGTGEMRSDSRGTVNVSATAAAADAVRAQEQRIRTAKTEEDRQAYAKDTSIYRLSLIFNGDEADAVRKALGDRPADRILEWCRREVGA